MSSDIPAYLLQMPTPEPATTIATYVGMALALAGAFWGVYHLVRHQEPLPLFLGIGGFLAGFLEPLFDVNGHIWFPVEGQWTAFELLGRRIPMFIPFGWCWNVGFVVALMWLGFNRGHIRGQTLWRWYGVALGVNILFELPGTAGGLYAYYGDQPLPLNDGGYSIAVPFANATAMLSAAFIAYRLQALFKSGVMAWTCGWFVTPFGFLAGAAPGWIPIFFAAQSTGSAPIVLHGLGVLSVLFSVATVWILRATLLPQQASLSHPSTQTLPDVSLAGNTPSLASTSTRGSR